MDIGLFQQAGHNTNWNTETFVEHHCGKGIIFSPADYVKSNIEALDSNILEASIFDPQYYLPSSQKKKLASYPFFPETITDGFSTTDFYAQAHESARQCLEFQIKCNFRYIIVPTRYQSQMVSDYFDRHENLTVQPFLEQLAQVSTTKPVYLGIAVTKHMVTDGGFRKTLLNWVTKFPELSGLYLIISDDRDSKQLVSSQDINHIAQFLQEAKAADLELLVGYCNTEGLVYGCLGGLEVSFGSFENTRKFSIDRYVVNEKVQRGPSPRIYLPGLFNWVRLSEAKNIRASLPDLWDKIYIPTEYGENALNKTVEPNFNNPDLYKHHFCVYSDQFNELASFDLGSRSDYMIEKINDAIAAYSKIASSGLLIDRHGSNDHLLAWRDSLGGAIFHQG